MQRGGTSLGTGAGAAYLKPGAVENLGLSHGALLQERDATDENGGHVPLRKVQRDEGSGACRIRRVPNLPGTFHLLGEGPVDREIS